MAVITISRQYASGGSDIARRVAASFGWTLIDNEFVDRVAELWEVPPEEVEVREERVPSLIERLARALVTTSPEVFVPAGDAGVEDAARDRLVHITEHVINEAVQHGDVVMVGRGAQAYLSERERTLHVFVVAARDARIAAAADRIGLDPEEAAQRVDETDDQRRRYVKLHYARDWDRAANYHLVLRSDVIGYDGCAELIVAAARHAGLAT